MAAVPVRNLRDVATDPGRICWLPIKVYETLSLMSIPHLELSRRNHVSDVWSTSDSIPRLARLARPADILAPTDSCSINHSSVHTGLSCPVDSVPCTLYLRDPSICCCSLPLHFLIYKYTVPAMGVEPPFLYGMYIVSYSVVALECLQFCYARRYNIFDMPEHGLTTRSCLCVR